MPVTSHEESLAGDPATDTWQRSNLLLAGFFGVLLGWGLYGFLTTVPYNDINAPRWQPDQAGPNQPGPNSGSQGIDPNTAPWWELTVLPGIGEITAKRIVEYRDGRRRELDLPDEAPVFNAPADLQKVHGIGPKKVEQMTPLLVFEKKRGHSTFKRSASAEK